MILRLLLVAFLLHMMCPTTQGFGLGGSGGSVSLQTIYKRQQPQQAPQPQQQLPNNNVYTTRCSSSQLQAVANEKTAVPASNAVSERTEKMLHSTTKELTEEMLEQVSSLLSSWAAQETVLGAQNIERILARLEQEVAQEDHNNENKLLSSLLTNKQYNLAIEAWVNSGDARAAEQAERILETMKEKWGGNNTHDTQQQQPPRPAMIPTRATYNAVMNAYSRRGDAKKTEALLTFMEQDTTLHLNPITSDYNVLLSAYAKLGEARQVENMFKRMIDRCQEQKKLVLDSDKSSSSSSSSYCAPDLYSYNMLLDSWAKSNEKGRGKRAETILSTMNAKFDSGEFQWKPNARSYSVAICAVVRSNEENSIERAEKMLAEAESKGIVADDYLYSALLDAYASCTASTSGAAEKAEHILDKLEHQGLATVVSYNTVLKAWKGSHESHAPARAEALVKRLEQRGLVDAFSYCTLIAAYANKGDQASAERAEEILEEMQQGGSKPNTQTMNAVMNAWIQCGKIQRAERILEKMETAFYEGERQLVPNVVSYTAIMNGWAKSKHPEAAARTEEFFQKMTTMFAAGNVQAQPNLFSYVTLITSITKARGARQKGAAHRAELVLFDMYAQYKNGTNTEVRPNTKVVTSVIDCWQKSGERDAGDRAEALLNWLIDAHKETKNKNDDTMMPNEFSFASAIGAWARTRKFGKSIRSRAILSKMIDMNRAGEINAQPNAYCYTAVINSCAYCENDPLEKQVSLQIAIKSYKELISSPEYGKPNHVTFSTIITALRYLTPQSRKRADAIKNIFKLCKEEGQVGEFVLRTLQSALDSDNLQQVCGKKAIADNGSVVLEDLPYEWKRNVNGR